MKYIRKDLDISAYLVVGPENTLGRPLRDIVSAAVTAGFTCVQVRSKVASAREMIDFCKDCAEVIASSHKSESVALLVDDRLAVVLASRERGIKVDGIHVGQTDIPVDICRKYLGEDSVVGLSARTDELLDYVRTCDVSNIDYFGAGPLHETATKPDCGLDSSGHVIIRTFDELSELSKISSIPVVVGGGVKVMDLPALKRTNVDGFFVVSAVASAADPAAAASELCSVWKNS